MEQSNNEGQSTNGLIEEFCNAVGALKTVVASVIQCKPIYTNKDMKAILGVSDKLLMRYRNDGLLAYSQVGDKFWYTQRDLEQFLERNAQVAYAYC